MENVIIKFLDMLERSIILQGLITAVMVSVCGYLWLTGQSVPDDLQKGLWLVLGFFFGGKVQQGIAYAASAMRNRSS